ncbi:hypothetical protein T484DRAFT_1789066, partial [Baffinella frigidus]
MASLDGHVADVLCVAFRTDGQLLATASADGEVRLWSQQPGAGNSSRALGTLSGIIDPDSAVLEGPMDPHKSWASLLACHAGTPNIRAMAFGRGESEGALA